MTQHTRRDILRHGALIGGGAVAVGAVGSLVSPAHARPTPQSGDVGAYASYRTEPAPKKSAPKKREWAVTEDNILGPFHRKGAPHRAKVTPPLAPGKTLLIQGRVFGFDTKAPLAGALIDVWQANHAGRYDNDDASKPPPADVFAYRARMLTDELGRYEYETIAPGRYLIGEKQWRPAHIHYWITAPGYRPLVTQLYFEGDPYNDADPFIKASLIIKLDIVSTPQGAYDRGTFDIVLARS